MAASFATRTFVDPVVSVELPSVLALAFDSQVVAQQALRAALGLQADGSLVVHDAVVINGEDDGSTSIVASMDPTAIAAAVPSCLVGALLGTLIAGPLGLLVGGAIAGGGGALLAKLADTGIPMGVIEELRATMESGQSGRCVLALLVSERRPGAMALFAMRCGTVGRSTILPCA